LLLNNVPSISPVAFAAFGSLSFNPGVDLTSIGMAGCFGYTNLNLGLYASGPVVGGTSTFALPIPSNPALAGTTIYAQGASLSALTVLGIASSNGLDLVVGN